MFHASSAHRTCAASRSISEYTAIARNPDSFTPRSPRPAISPRLAASTESMGGMLERDVPVFLGRECDPLGSKHVERLDEAGAGLPGFDHLVDQPPFCGDGRV